MDASERPNGRKRPSCRPEVRASVCVWGGVRAAAPGRCFYCAANVASSLVARIIGCVIPNWIPPSRRRPWNDVFMEVAVGDPEF